MNGCCIELQNFLVCGLKLVLCKIWWLSSSNHPPKITFTMPIPRCHIELNFNHTFYWNYGPVPLIIIQPPFIQMTPAVYALAAKSVRTSQITSCSTLCVLAPPSFSSILTFYSAMGIGRSQCLYFMTWWRINTSVCLLKLIKKIKYMNKNIEMESWQYMRMNIIW